MWSSCLEKYLHDRRGLGDKERNNIMIFCSAAQCCLILGGLQDVRSCSFDHFENCGAMDKSSSTSRWAFIAEEYSADSTSKLTLLFCCALVYLDLVPLRCVLH